MRAALRAMQIADADADHCVDDGRGMEEDERVCLI
jgi:hypothetical protein